MVQVAWEHRGSGLRTLAAFDMEKVPPLTESLSKLMESFRAEMSGENGEFVKWAVREARKSPQKFGPGSRQMDLGQWLSALCTHREHLSLKTQSLIQEAQNHLDEVVIIKAAEKGYETVSGISLPLNANDP